MVTAINDVLLPRTGIALGASGRNRVNHKPQAQDPIRNSHLAALCRKVPERQAHKYITAARVSQTQHGPRSAPCNRLHEAHVKSDTDERRSCAKPHGIGGEASQIHWP